MKALSEIGWRAAVRYIVYTFLLFYYRLLLFSPLRVAFLRLLGAHIGKNAVIHELRFFNHYRKGLRALNLGDNVFIGDETLFDLADEITLERDVTLAERVTVLTHTNVGYRDHPLQKYFPPFTQAVRFRRGCFVGVNATIMPGVEVGEEAFVAAGAVVVEDVAARAVVMGVPARKVREVPDEDLLERWT